MNKHKSVINFLNFVDAKFGENIFTIVDYWNIKDAIGLTYKNKLIFINRYKNKQFFYECELHSTDDMETEYKVYDSGTATEKQLLDIMSKFFDIKMCE